MSRTLVGIFPLLSTLQNSPETTSVVLICESGPPLGDGQIDGHSGTSPLRGTGKGAMVVDSELASPIGTGTAEDPGR